MLGALKLHPGDRKDEAQVSDSFTAELLANRRREILAFAEALRNENLIQHASSSNGDETFSSLIQLAVAGYGVSQRQLAQAVDVNIATVSRWVAGISCPPRLSRPSIMGAVAMILEHDLDVTRP